MIRFLFILVFSIFVLFPSWCAGQNDDSENLGPLSLEVHQGSDKNDIGNDVTSFNNGVYTAGVTLGELPGCGTSGKWDAFLIRYSPDGEIVWCRQWGTPGRDSASGIAADSTGIYVTGFAEGSMEGNPYNGDLMFSFPNSTLTGT